jgi:hypothetical protein
MKKIQSVFYTFIIICFCSCEKDAEVKLPKVEEKLTINCAFSPQDGGIAVYVSLSQPIFNTSTSNEPYPPITNATVIISSSEGTWTLPYDAHYKTYMIYDTTVLKIRAGMTYYLSVSTPEGKFVKAQTTIPYQNNTFSYTTVPNTNTTANITLHATWSDPASSSDYYEFVVRYENFHNHHTFRSDFLTDEGNPGGVFKKEVDIQYDPTLNDSIYAGVYTLAPELYKYYDRLDKANNSGGPFSEPVPMYTNIEGGYGIFGSFNANKVQVLP